MDAEAIIKRLSMVRHVYELGKQQLDGPFPAAAVLSFHDAIELFLLLGIEHHQVEKKSRDFMQLFDELKKKIPQLEGRILAEHVNAARNPIKHVGLQITQDEAEASEARTRSFLEQNTKTLFEIEFFEFSMSRAIQDDVVREHIIAAEQALSVGAYSQCLSECAVAFRELETRHDIVGRYSAPPHIWFHFDLPRELKSISDDIYAKLSTIETRLNLFTLGIDREQYNYFKAVIPMVQTNVLGQHTVLFNNPVEPSETCAERCVHYVTDAALALEQAARRR